METRRLLSSSAPVTPRVVGTHRPASIAPPSGRGAGYESPTGSSWLVTHYVVFDLETVPDLAVARRLLGLDAAVPDDAMRKAIGKKYARRDQQPGEVFLKAPFHRVVCIGALYAER